MSYEKCPECDGHGVVSDYGLFGVDFFGPKTCPLCKGNGLIRARDKNGRFIKLNE